MTTINKVLHLLEKEEQYISGQKLADQCNVSRNAIWKVINTLKIQGYDIEAISNKGYRLVTKKDRLIEHTISSLLTFDCHCVVLESIDSTNTEAKRRSLNEETYPLLLVANEQTEGRGRSNKSFYSPKDSGLYMTLMIKPKLKVWDAQLITVAVANVVCRSIESISNIKPMIKWVNDIYIDDKKVGGILTEMTSDFESMEIQQLIIGVGINISTTLFPKELQSIANSLHDTTIKRNQLCALIANGIMSGDLLCNKEEIIHEYKQRSIVLGNVVMFEKDGIMMEGIAEDIDLDGNLIINVNNKLISLNSGEISVRRKNEINN